MLISVSTLNTLQNDIGKEGGAHFSDPPFETSDHSHWSVGAAG